MYTFGPHSPQPKLVSQLQKALYGTKEHDAQIPVLEACEIASFLAINGKDKPHWKVS